jgi:hypothetical protein
VVVSGEPYITPIFIRIWLMKITMVLDLLIEAVSLRSAWLISRACRPGSASPISPSSSAFGTKGRHRIDHQHVDRAGAHQRVADFQRLLAGVGLRDQEFVDVDAELSGIDRIERVFGIDEGADAALLLALGHRVQRQRGLAGGFRPVDFDHPALGRPPTPSAISSPSEPEEMVSTSIERSFLPSFITEPLPNWRSIWESAADRALVLSMEDPSTIRRASGGHGRAPYGGDSLAGQTGDGNSRTGE